MNTREIPGVLADSAGAVAVILILSAVILGGFFAAETPEQVAAREAREEFARDEPD